MREGVRDFSISRTAVDWGIRFPSDPKHTVYVWFDALIGEPGGRWGGMRFGLVVCLLCCRQWFRCRLIVGADVCARSPMCVIHSPAVKVPLSGVGAFTHSHDCAAQCTPSWWPQVT